MNSFNNKRPAYMYAKGFKLDKFLGNLQQLIKICSTDPSKFKSWKALETVASLLKISILRKGYKIATGQVSKDELRNVSDRYGSDEGAVFGSLITNASRSSKKEDSRGEPPAKRRRRRKRRKQNSKEEDVETSDPTSTVLKPNLSSCPLTLDEPLTIPSALLAYKDCDSSDDNDSKNDKNGNSSAESAEESDGTDEDDADFFGLNSNTKNSESHKSIKTSGEISSKWPMSVSQKTEGRRQPYKANFSEKQQDVWDSSKLKYKDPVSTLSSYKCWKCRRVGHLAEDCTVKTSNSAMGSLFECGQASSPHRQQTNSQGLFYSSSLKEYYKRCQKLRESRDAKCSDCGVKSNLAYCFECGLILCDGRGHLIDHLLEYPSHTKLYSYKLQRQVKCCKSTCEVVDATELLMCSSCLDRAFTSHYSMINATWSRTGLKAIPNALTCEQHFHWHRMNCANSTGEALVTREKLENSRTRGEGLLSEFYF